MSDTLQATRLAAPVLVLGPAYSGKSEFGTQLLRPDAPAVVLGTAPAAAGAGSLRIAELKALRPPVWETVDASTDLPAALAAAATRAPQILVDSTSQWLAGVAVARETLSEALLEAELNACAGELLRVAAGLPAGTRLAIVAAEVGAGPAPQRVPERQYRRAVGLLNRQLAALARTVVVMTAGLPQRIKG